MKSGLDLISLSSSEVDLENWYPTLMEDIFICLDIEVNFLGYDAGNNLFYVTLATLESLMKHRKGPCLVKNRTIIVSEYSYEIVHNIITEILAECSKNTWLDSCAELQKYFRWEYEVNNKTVTLKKS